ncbi:hypothetical protein XabCFBP2524_20205 [Xanthomonas axonopodis pv. begoniae]|nr:hypothetical protein XabCFBP2524_20205 [Xanthomonas axonopodis pv. begoniae]
MQGDDSIGAGMACKMAPLPQAKSTPAEPACLVICQGESDVTRSPAGRHGKIEGLPLFVVALLWQKRDWRLAALLREKPHRTALDVAGGKQLQSLQRFSLDGYR